MTERRPDAERLAALLDGRMTGNERSRMLAELAESEEGAELLADAIVATGEVQAGAAGGGTPSTPGRPTVARPRWQWLGRGALALAAIALLLALPWTMTRRAERDASSAHYLAYAGSIEARPDGWNPAPWPRTRGATESLSREARAVRVGAWLIELELELTTRGENADDVAREIARLLDEMPGGAAAAAHYTALAAAAESGSVPAAPARADARAAVEQTLGTHVRIGTWLQGARLAASRDDLGSVRQLSPGFVPAGASNETEALLDRARAATQRAQAGQMSARELLVELTEVLSALAS